MKKKIRVSIPWNTGTRVHIPIKGKSSYTRKVKHKKNIDNETENE